MKARVFKLLEKFHVSVSRRLLNVRIGMRLLLLMGLGGVIALLLAAVGILGLSASKESLRAVYEERMLPVQQLASIVNLMLANRMLLQGAISEVSLDIVPEQPAVLVMNPRVAAQAADAIEKNIARIGTLWQTYASAALSAEERVLANRFAQSRSAFVNDALRPALASLRTGDYAETRRLVSRAHVLYDQAGPDLNALNQLQFGKAREAYASGIQRYDNTRLIALGALGGALLLMSWLGWMLTTSIVQPLQQAIVIFRHISNGQYNAPIAVQGRDEISQVMGALQEMQIKLGVDEEAIHQLAFYDSLTQLPNRRLLRDRLQQALSASTRTHLYGAVLMIDLDNFKSINDSRGHDIGDQLLAEVALRIQSCLRQSDTVARIGGDEFSVVLVDLDTQETQAALLAERVSEKIMAALNQPFLLTHKLHHNSASMGLCLFQGQNATLEELLKRADIAMYQAKNSGRNALRFFDPQIQATLEARVALESELHEALPGRQLKLYYQVQVDASQGVTGAEVLLRWQHPTHGLVLPDQFIPLAEESGLIVPMGEWVLRTACEQLAVWSRQPMAEHFLLSVNVSARQFRQPDFVTMVERILLETGIDPQRLKLELTESLVLHNVPDTIAKMKALNLRGIHFSMDDFGTGYSSLSHLTHLPIQQLKIDRSFVRHIASNHNDAVIAQTIIGMARNLGVAVIAEGVEDEEQRACLERLGCPSFQGYLFGRPMPLHEFEARAMPALMA